MPDPTTLHDMDRLERVLLDESAGGGSLRQALWPGRAGDYSSRLKSYKATCASLDLEGDIRKMARMLRCLPPPVEPLQG
jgi:hypothetical protein